MRELSEHTDRHTFRARIKEAFLEPRPPEGLLYLPECSCGWTGLTWRNTLAGAHGSWQENHRRTL